MKNPSFLQLQQMALQPEAVADTISYLTRKLSFLKEEEPVLICFREQGENSISYLMEQAVIRCGAVPILWGEDHRWKTLLRLAFESRAGTVIGPPLIVLGLCKLAKRNVTPLFVRRVVTAGYPCLDWMIDGIIRSLDCDTWGCFEPGAGAVIAGFSCNQIRGIHLRDDVYGVCVVDSEGNPLPDGACGEMVIYPKSDPQLRCRLGEYARIERTPCSCGSGNISLLDLCYGESDNREVDLLAQKLYSWSSVLDCRVQKGPYGLEMELVVFPGEQLPVLPSCARQVIRPWVPEQDEPLWYMPFPGIF